MKRFFRFAIALTPLACVVAAEPPANILGRWSTGRVSTIQYRDAYTHAPSPTSGNNFAYEFKADGTYSFTGLMQNTFYNCTTSMFSNETGTYLVEGDSVSLKPEKNPYKMTNSCAPSSNKEAPGKLIPKTYRYRTGQDGNFLKLILTGDDGKSSEFRRDR